MKALVIGYGSIGKRHIDNLSKFPNLKILVCTKRKSDIFLKRTNCKTFKSLESSIKQKPDFAIISNVTKNHSVVANKLAKAGISFFIEKPLSDSLKSMNELLKEVKRRKLVTLMGCNLRFHPCIKKIKEMVDKKEIGKPISIRVENGSYLPDWHIEEDYRNSYAARKDLGGGVLLTCIHEIDYLCWLFGKVKEVFSITGKFSDLDITVEDLSAVLLKFKNNVIAEVHLDYFQRPSFRSCKVIGTKGTIYWDSDINSVKVYDVKKRKWITRMKLNDYDDNSSYIDELSYFLNCVKKKKQTINTVFDGVKILKIVLDIKKAQKLKKLVIVK